MALYRQISDLTVRSHMIVSMRVMGFAGLWALHPGEAHRMWAEKPTAIAASGLAVALMMGTARRPSEVAEAALFPFLERTESNLQRLADRPRLPGPQCCDAASAMVPAPRD